MSELTVKDNTVYNEKTKVGTFSKKKDGTVVFAFVNHLHVFDFVKEDFSEFENLFNEYMGIAQRRVVYELTFQGSFYTYDDYSVCHFSTLENLINYYNKIYNEIKSNKAEHYINPNRWNVHVHFLDSEPIRIYHYSNIEGKLDMDIDFEDSISIPEAKVMHEVEERFSSLLEKHEKEYIQASREDRK